MAGVDTRIASAGMPRAIGVAFCIQTVISFLAAIVPVIAVEIAATKHWDVNAVTFYVPLVYASALAVGFGVPALLARCGAALLGIICIACAALGQLALLAADWRLVILAPLMIGFAIGGMNPVTSQILSPYASPRNAATITAIKQTGVPLGAVVAGLLAPLFAVAGGWMMAVACSTIIGLSIAGALLPTGLTSRRREHAPRRPTHPLEPIKRLIALPGIKTVIVAGIAYVVAQWCLRSFFTVYLVRDVGLTLSFAGLAFAATQAAGIAGQLFWATLCGRVMTHHAVLAVIGTLMAVASAITACANGTWGAVALLGVSGLFGFTAAGFIPVVLGAVMTSSTADQAGALTSALNLFLIGSSLLGPIAFGAIAQSVGYSGAFFALAAVCMAGALSCVLGYVVNSSRSGRFAGHSISALRGNK